MLKSSLLTAALAVALIAPAAAQTDPNDTGRGLERGLAAMNSSAQVGSFTILRGSGGMPEIQVNVKGAPADHPEAVTISRGMDCRTADHAVVYVLGNAVGGQLHATSPLPFGRLTSGNYSIVVHNNTPESRAVVCGHVYIN